MLRVKIKKLFSDLKMPDYGHPGDAGLDLYSREDKTIKPGEIVNFMLGFALEFPGDYVALVRDKSGLPTKYGIHTMAGVFDSGYRGEYNVTLINLSQKSYQFKKGDKLAQLLIMPCQRAEFQEVAELSDSSRGEGRWGSTGR